MNRTRWLGAIAAVVVLVAGLVSSAGTASAAVPGGTIQGTGGGTYLVGSTITMNYSLLSAPNPYTGFNIGVVFSSASLPGGAITTVSVSASPWAYPGVVIPAQTLNTNLSLLPPPLLANIVAGVGVGTPTTITGPLANMKWTATNAGVTAAHMISFGPPDNGGAAAGTFTVDVTNTAQANTLACGDGGAFTSAAGYCGPLPVPSSVAADSVFNIVPPPPVLVTTKTASVSSLVAGQPMSFTLGVSNSATPATTATGVVLTDTLNAAFLGGPVTFTPAAAPCTFVSPTVTCNVGSLAPSASFSVIVNVVTDGTKGGTTYSNTACATSTNVLTGPPVCAQASVHLIPPAVGWSKTPTSANLFIAENATPPGGTSFTFDEVMTNQGDPAGLGGFSFVLHYDPTQYTAPVIDMSPAVALFAAASPARVLTCNIGPAFNGMINVACASTGTFGSGPVWVGNKVMAHVTVSLQAFVVQSIRPNKENGDLSWVKDDQVTVTNTCGQPLNDGSIQPLPGQPECQGKPLQGVGPGGVLTGNPNGGESTQTWRRLEGDVTKDCKVDVADMQLEASKYGTGVGSLLYSLFYDVNTPFLSGDGRIDIQDIQFIYGRSGSTCTTPIPPQP